MSWHTPLRVFIINILFIAPLLAHESAVVDHHDPVKVDPQMTLPQVIQHTLENFPRQRLTQALQEQADALQQQGDSWLAGPSYINMRYQDDTPFDDYGSREFEPQVQLQLWNWGQREAGQDLALQAKNAAERFSDGLRLEVAGAVRNALWNIELNQIRHEQAQAIFDISTQLLAKIQRRVDLGDLPRSDLLLAQTDHLQKRSDLIQAEAELMHARKFYTNLTQLDTIPAQFEETLSPLNDIPPEHPKLQSINADIKRYQAQVDWVKAGGSGQNNLYIGGITQKGGRGQPDIESMVVQVSIPFGGDAQLAPQVAAANLQLNQALADRDQLYRDLERAHHEARHDLQVIRAELEIANHLKSIAEDHLKMSQLSFSVGEINLMDLLRIQSNTFNAIRHAREHEVMLKKNIALYNQAVGSMPGQP